MSDAAPDTGSAADTPFGKATPGVKPSSAGSSASDVMKGLVSQTMASNADAQAKIKELPEQVAKIHAETDIKEKSLQEQLQTLTDAQVEALKSKPPAQQPTNLAEQWGSPAMLMAIFGSAFTRTPLTNALNAGAKVMTAYQQRDFDAANHAYKEWEHSNDTALKLTKIQTDMLEKAMTEVRSASKEDINEKMAEMRLMVGPGALNIPVIRAMADAGQWDRVQAVVDDLKTNQPKMHGAAEDFKRLHNLQQEDRDAATALAEANSGKDPEKIAAATEHKKATAQAVVDEYQRQNPSKGKKESGWTIVTTPDGKTLRVNPNTGETAPMNLPAGSTRMGQQTTVPELKYPEKWDGMPETPPPGVREDVWDLTLAYARTHVMPTLGFQPGMRNQIVATYPAALHALGIKPSEAPDIQAEYAGERHGMVVGGGRAAQIGLGIEEAKKAAPQVIATSKAVPRTEFPDANRFNNWLQEKTGDPNIVAFREALNTYLNIYAATVSRTGRLTDTQQNHAYNLLSTNFNQGQIERGIQQLDYEMSLMREAVQPAMEGITPIGQPPAIRKQVTPATPPQTGAGLSEPPWAKNVTTSADGTETIYGDGKEWFHADHTPYKPKAD